MGSTIGVIKRLASPALLLGGYLGVRVLVAAAARPLVLDRAAGQRAALAAPAAAGDA